MADYISREAAAQILRKEAANHYPTPFHVGLLAAARVIEAIPAADVPPALWTDEPISGTEFMTHRQGQSGFEIHFRTDDKAKYEAVQDECRRQIGHAKPAADVRPVVRGKWSRVYDDFMKSNYDTCSCCGKEYFGANGFNFCPNCGAEMEES